ncbi:phosphate signaling complex protein PhoU [Clostridium oryzae]|uniref:Phosphate-specific transport system accessory protein PhoU n=1 Tax=Clostridium oryzae TaxID=1450648 RepID=A0A1V4IHF1_9CLOT|nr:phosphate signaling complex protein PhoU [Clostridium oryzae]OPJ59105.1 hypothetical protein CLORY_34340 [Clostridium oryzae]
MTRGGFDINLQSLHNDILKMGSIVEKQIHESILALSNQDEELAEKVIENDDKVDDLQKEIEDKCVKLIAMQQPLATDLRNIFTTIKLVTDLERIADHAVDVAKIAKILKKQKYIKELVDIPKMAVTVEKMIHESLNSYVEADIDKAYATCKIDDEVDAVYKKVFTELLERMATNPEDINQATQFLFVCKYLERVADHVTNICEGTIYLVTGEQVDLND